VEKYKLSVRPVFILLARKNNMNAFMTDSLYFLLVAHLFFINLPHYLIFLTIWLPSHLSQVISTLLH